MLEKYNIEEELEEKGTKIRIKNITYNDSPLDIENESKSLFFSHPYKTMEIPNINFECEEIETGKIFSYNYNLTLDRREIQGPLTNPNLPGIISFEKNSYLRQEEEERLKEVLLNTENLMENPLSKAILEHNLVNLDKDLVLNLLDNDNIEIASFLPQELIQDKEITSKILEEFNKYEISNDYEPQELANNPEYLVSIIRNIDWQEQEQEINIEL